MDHADKMSEDTSGIPGLEVVPLDFRYLPHFDLLRVILSSNLQCAKKLPLQKCLIKMDCSNIYIYGVSFLHTCCFDYTEFTQT